MSVHCKLNFKHIINFTLFNCAVFFVIATFSVPALSDSNTSDDCSAKMGAFDNRHCVEKSISKQSFVLIPYKPNYLIGSFVDGLDGGIEGYQNFETKFQISFKIPLSKYEKPARCFWIDNTQCITFIGYSQISVWQMLNSDRSAPFRDTNFEPELMVAQLLNKDIIAGWKLRQLTYGLVNHQSNGKIPPSSRSWNRSYLDFMFGKNNNYITFKVWSRWAEKPKSSPTDFKGDDNENIEDYVGNGELKYLHVDNSINYSLEIRDSEYSSNKFNLQLNWSIPLKDLSSTLDDNNLRLYVQYFNGYGETLIDYNVKRERIGVGVMLSDWL